MRRQAMTVWTFKISSVFRNKLFLDISLDGSNGLDDIEESLSRMELRSRTGCSYTSVTESLNTLWQNMLKEKTQELDGINLLFLIACSAQMLSYSACVLLSGMYLAWEKMTLPAK